MPSPQSYGLLRRMHGSLIPFHARVEVCIAVPTFSVSSRARVLVARVAFVAVVAPRHCWLLAVPVRRLWNWVLARDDPTADRNIQVKKVMLAPGLEPGIFRVLGGRVNQLRHANDSLVIRVTDGGTKELETVDRCERWRERRRRKSRTERDALDRSMPG